MTLSALRRRRLAWLALTASLLAGLMALFALWHWELARGERDARQHAATRLNFYASTLNAELSRFQWLPELLARQARVRIALDEQSASPAATAPVIPSDQPDTSSAAAPLGSSSDLNQHLRRVASASGAAAIFLTDRNGMTVAASNFDQPDSFVGYRYDYRPYFIDALARGRGEFFAVGNTTGRPGYFVSAPVLGAEGQPLGVMVVKVSLEALEDTWRQAGETVLLADANRIVLLASRRNWKYRALEAIEPQALDSIRAQQQFRGAPLTPLSRELEDGSLVLGDHHELAASEIVRLPTAAMGQRYLDESLASGPLGWQLHFLMPLRPLYIQARNVVLVGLAVILGLAMMALWMRERQARLGLIRREAVMMREINERLEERVAQRSRELEATRDELVQAGKLAALGTMAAGIAHELNQPLVGIRTYAASGGKLLARGVASAATRPELTARAAESAASNFTRISELSERLADMIRQLRVFVRPASQQAPVALALAPRIDFALELLAERITALDLTVEQGGLPRDIIVMGEQVRLEQLLTNLIRNALDALEGEQKAQQADQQTGQQSDASDDEHVAPRLRLSWQAWPAVTSLEGQPGGCLRIEDNGPGIDPALRATLFDPFTTTREVGEGMGMGLFLSYGLARDLGGQLRLADGASVSEPAEGSLQTEGAALGGACFELWLRTPASEGGHDGDGTGHEGLGHESTEQQGSGQQSVT
ncbi:cache domain-containing protein [Cobetia sp. MB87]|uniref:sensor histidine kinase n=1 Tax=Cobetia sp. MB87 TaxID=2588451 RepID=UPI00140BA3C2|nr:cache domain-containing protein [Cobetia sp. MB87]NHH86818.1 C4-dicarboxylate transport sensor protein DctB [Cobetia sp. MB87]